MHIFIDESGIFIDPKDSETHKVSAVGALAIPHESYDDIISAFIHLKQHLGVRGEMKGSKLDENIIDQVVQLLEKFDVLFDAVIIDSKFLKSKDIEAHKKYQAQKFIEHISPEHHPQLVQDLHELKNTLETSISNQLYVQSIAMTDIIYNVHQLSTLYYVQRNPRELASFKWIIDAKDRAITTAEGWWKEVIMPFIQDMSFQKPLKLIEGANYSYYNKFLYKDKRGGNIKKILADLSFKDSSTDEGLQIVDILTGALCRAMNHKLKRKGWHRMGKLMVIQQDQNIQLLILKAHDQSTVTVPYYDVIQHLNETARPMLVK